MKQSVFAIETSCDETAISVLVAEKNSDGQIVSLNILAHEVVSQTESHAPFGGVVPEVAARDHLTKIPVIANLALEKSGLSFSKIDSIAVTTGPGLIGALMVGVLFAKGLAYSLNKPLIAVNHVDAHLAPSLLLNQFVPNTDLGVWQSVRQIEYPSLALTVSGGHCHLILLNSLTDRQLLGKSLDDACGEAFDKVAKLLGFGYPGGPIIEELALAGEELENSEQFIFPHKIANRENRYSFSYSGLKTSVLEVVKKETNTKKGKVSGALLQLEKKQLIALSFQKAAIMQLYDRVENALQDFGNIKSVFVAGGVAQNKKFREVFLKLNKPVFFAPPSLCSDNATMIGMQALLQDNKNAANIPVEPQPFAKYFSEN